jgi:hypothetical protein
MAAKRLVNMVQTIGTQGINQTTLVTVTASGLSREFYDFASVDAAVFYVDVTAVAGSGTFQLTLQERDPASGVFFTAADAPAFTAITGTIAGQRTASWVPLGECYTLNWNIGSFTSVTFSCVAQLISWGVTGTSHA